MDTAANIRGGPRPRFRDLAPPLATRTVYAGPSVSVYEWRCAGHRETGSEEWTEGYEVVVPRRGVFEWTVRGDPLLADPATAIFLHPWEPYRVRHPIAGGDAGSVFRLRAGAIRALLGREPDEDGAAARFPLPRVTLDGRTYLLQRLAVRAAGVPGACAVEVEERVGLFLATVIGASFRQRGQPRPAPCLTRRAREYAARVAEVVAARYREPLTLADVADAVGVSPFYLSRVVTAATGVPIYRMILRRRLRDALEMLLETRDGISAIALAVGFASHSHLTDAFRREFGVPPREARRLRPEELERLTAPRR